MEQMKVSKKCGVNAMEKVAEAPVSPKMGLILISETFFVACIRELET